MDDEDYQAKIEELEEETDKLEDVFEKFKAQSEAQSEEFEKELQAFQAEIQDLQMQIDEKTQELEELNSIAHKSAREEVELKKKAKAIQQKIDTLAEDIRKLENECTSCRQSVRVGSAKNKNMSVSLRNSNRRKKETKMNLDSEKVREQAEMDRLQLYMRSAKDVLDRARAGEATDKEIREEVEAIKELMAEEGYEEELDDDDDSEMVSGDTKADPEDIDDIPLATNAFTGDANQVLMRVEAVDGDYEEDDALRIVVAQARTTFLARYVDLVECLEKRIESGEPVRSAVDLKSIFEEEKIVFDDDQMDMIVSSNMNKETNQIELETLLHSIGNLNVVTRVNSLDGLSDATRHFLISQALTSAHEDNSEIPDSVAALQAILARTPESDERHEAVDILKTEDGNGECV